jgi:hypothetical protein
MLTYEDGPHEAELDRQVAEILGWKDFKLSLWRGRLSWEEAALRR